MNAYACFPDLPSPVQRYIRTLEADKEALEADRAALEARAAVAARRIAELSERVRVQRSRARSESGSGHRREDGSPAGHGSAARGAALTRTPAGPARAARRT